MFGNSLLQMC